MEVTSATHDTFSGVRSIHEVTLDELTSLNVEVQALVSERVPRAFPPEMSWGLWATGLLARSASILDAITALAERGRRADAEVALRTLYVHVTTLCWLAIDPESNVDMWHSNSQAMWGVFDREARDFYGIEVLERDDAAELATTKMRPLNQLADDIDAYWPKHVEAFRAHPEGRKEILSFRGIYTAIFRSASRIAHAEVDSLQSNLRVSRNEIVVSMTEPPRFGRAAFALPLMAFALLAYDHHFGWPGEPRTSRMVEALNYNLDRAADDPPVGKRES